MFASMVQLPFVVVMRDDDPLAACAHVTPDQLVGRAMTFTCAAAYNAVLDRIFRHYHIAPVIHSYANDDVAMFCAFVPVPPYSSPATIPSSTAMDWPSENWSRTFASGISVWRTQTGAS